jgi:hypothetical protein
LLFFFGFTAILKKYSQAPGRSTAPLALESASISLDTTSTAQQQPIANQPAADMDMDFHLKEFTLSTSQLEVLAAVVNNFDLSSVPAFLLDPNLSVPAVESDSALDLVASDVPPPPKTPFNSQNLVESSMDSSGVAAAALDEVSPDLFPAMASNMRGVPAKDSYSSASIVQQSTSNARAGDEICTKHASEDADKIRDESADKTRDAGSQRAPSPSHRAPSPSHRAPSPSHRAPSPSHRAPSPSRRTDDDVDVVPCTPLQDSSRMTPTNATDSPPAPNILLPETTTTNQRADKDEKSVENYGMDVGQPQTDVALKSTAHAAAVPQEQGQESLPTTHQPTASPLYPLDATLPSPREPSSN